MNLVKSGWEFDESVSGRGIFNSHVRDSVPLYDEIHSLIRDMSGWYLQDGTNMYDIGCSTGEVLYNLTNTYPNKEVNYIGIDNSPDMIKHLKEEEPPFEVIETDVTNDFTFLNASLITSVLTLMFIPIHKRQQLVNEIYDGLLVNGAFILVEKIIGNDARFNDMFVQLYHDMKLENGLSEKHVFEKARSIRGVLVPNTIGENYELLRNVGFESIDIFFKWNNFVGIMAVK